MYCGNATGNTILSASPRLCSTTSLVSCRENATDEARTLKFGRDDFDIILASDCLYDPAMFPALRQALVAMCGPQSVFIMAYKRRLDRYVQNKPKECGI